MPVHECTESRLGAKGLTSAWVTGAMLAINATAMASVSRTPYVSTCLRSAIAQSGTCGFPGLSADFGGAVVPKQLPKRELAPIALRLWGKVSTTDGTHPSALREATIDFDRNLVISAKGLPVCGPHPSLDMLIPEAPKDCRNSIIGGGKADFELAFPEAPLIRNQSKLIVYNAGVKGGVMTLYAVAVIEMPAPRTISIQIELERIHNGRTGLRAVAKIPVIAGGSGSLLDFNLKIKRLFDYKGSQRSYVMARCLRHQLGAEIKALFENEAQTPGVPSSTVIEGRVAIPCTPLG